MLYFVVYTASMPPAFPETTHYLNLDLMISIWGEGGGGLLT